MQRALEGQNATGHVQDVFDKDSNADSAASQQLTTFVSRARKVSSCQCDTLFLPITCRCMQFIHELYFSEEFIKRVQLKLSVFIWYWSTLNYNEEKQLLLRSKAKSNSGASSAAATSDGANESQGEYRRGKYHHLFSSEFLRPYGWATEDGYLVGQVYGSQVIHSQL